MSIQSKYRSCAVLLLILLLTAADPVQCDLLTVDSLGACTEPAVGAGPDALARIVWVSAHTGIKQLYWGAYDPAGNCIYGPFQITENVTTSRVPRIGVDTANRSFIIWFEGTGSSTKMYFTRLGSDGATEIADTQISAVGGLHKRVDLAVTPSGISHLVLEYQYSTFFRIQYIVLDENGVIVRNINTANNDIFGFEKYPTINLDPAGTATLTWSEYAGFFTEGLYAAQYSSAGTQLFNGMIKNGSDITWSAVLTPRTDRLWILFQQYYSGADRIMIYEGNDSASPISPPPGPTRRPRMAGADGNPVYAVWEDRSSGISRIMALEWDMDGYIVDNSIAVSDSPVDATAPDIATDGAGQYYVVWQDARSGEDRIYYDSVKSCGIRVTAEVRPAHGYDDFIDPPPPLPGVSVTLNSGSRRWTTETDLTGLAEFAVAPEGEISYDMSLSGQYYHVATNYIVSNYNQDPVTTSYTAQPGETFSLFTWPGGDGLSESPALQAAYFIQLFRLDYWKNRLGYTYRLPSRFGLRDDDYIEVQACEYAITPGTDGLKIGFMANNCVESSVVYHELSHCMVSEHCRSAGWHDFIRTSDEDKEGEAIDEALADYFAASYANDPVIDPHNTKFIVWLPLRDISNSGLEYPTIYPSSCDFMHEGHSGSLILSGTLWDLRAQLDGAGADTAPITDDLVLATLDTMLANGPGNDTSFRFNDFYNAMKLVDSARGNPYEDEIDAVFGSHNIGVFQVSYCPIHWEEGSSWEDVRKVGSNILELTWHSLQGATYNVRLKLIDWMPQRNNLTDGYVLIAEGLTDTTYTITDLDPYTDYFLVIEPVDVTGEPGFFSEPAFIEAYSITDAKDPDDAPVSKPGGRWLFNSPNPFNPVSHCYFEVFREDLVTIRVFDVAGRRVRTLDSRRYDAGRHSIAWDGKNDNGQVMASGMYFIRVAGSDWQDVGKVILLK